MVEAGDVEVMLGPVECDVAEFSVVGEELFEEMGAVGLLPSGPDTDQGGSCWFEDSAGFLEGGDAVLSCLDVVEGGDKQDCVCGLVAEWEMGEVGLDERYIFVGGSAAFRLGDGEESS